MTLQEATALVILYRACGDAEARRRALRYAPTLEELVGEVASADSPKLNEAKRWRLFARASSSTSGKRYLLEYTDVVCLEGELELHKAVLASKFDLAPDFKIDVEDLS